MEDWQGCLNPTCQKALQSALDSVTRRGGYAVTLEDFLLAMLDEIPDLCRFLQRQGVDLDELTRTIQCEQPIVTAVASDNLLSSQLVYWFSSAREISGAVWLEWPTLLQTLVQSSERLQEKAYVAVLELVTHWPFTHSEDAETDFDQVLEASPLVMADDSWAALAEDVSVTLAAARRGLVWIRGDRGSGKSSWLKLLIAHLPGGAVEVDTRREADILASDRPVVPTTAGEEETSIPPALVLDNVSPADLMTMMATEFSVARELVTSFPGPVLMLSPESPAASSAVESLQSLLGRDLECFAMPATCISQRLGILIAHQPLIEKRWRIELAPGVAEYVAASQNAWVASPGAMLQWVERAAARLSLFAERGPTGAQVLAGRADTIRRQSLLALARHQPVQRLEESLEVLAIERAATEVTWHERKQEGTLRLLRVDDLKSELERRVAGDAGSGHYIAEQNQIRELDIARS
ncbi:hypothetical protein [Marinobacter halotolerans]|uniref:hypothetical protein n=1 Tax=Marinobacter halotolerans TaxID=1569211 RepID=UPI001246336C|nr:hypothetical protein [Marinobacter halotolerans]